MSDIKLPKWAGSPPDIDEKAIVDTVTADVVVVGSGNAGVLAATAAAFSGASVSVIEEQTQEKFWMYGLADIGTINSKWALAKGAPRIDEVEVIREWQHRTMNRSDPRLINQFVWHSGEMLDWLLGMVDPKHADKATIANFPAPDNRHTGEVSGFRSWVGTCQLRTWNKDVRQVIAKAEAHGAKWYWKNRGRVLVQDRNGRVMGCIAENAEGKYVKYLARKGVILSSGDFGGNHEMYVNLYHEVVEQYKSYGLDTGSLKSFMGRNGDGHLMAVWAGGSMEPGPYASVYPTAMTVICDDSNLGRWGGGFSGTSFMRVDGRGKRYCDEGILGIYGILHRSMRMGPGPYYSVFDAKWEEYVQRQCEEHFMLEKDQRSIENARRRMQRLVEGGAGNESPMPEFDDGPGPDGPGGPGGPPGPPPGGPQGKAPYQWAAQSLDELAGKLGFEGEIKETFLFEVERYNRMCSQGRDEDFAKDPRLLMSIDTPPFFATESLIQRPDTGLVMLNGVVTDENQAVLGKDYRPIPGLFATGNCGGGKFFMQYASVLAGVAIGTAMTLGMLLGRHVASLPSDS